MHICGSIILRENGKIFKEEHSYIEIGLFKLRIKNKKLPDNYRIAIILVFLSVILQFETFLYKIAYTLIFIPNLHETFTELFSKRCPKYGGKGDAFRNVEF